MTDLTPEQFTKALVEGRLRLSFDGPSKTIGDKLARRLYVQRLNEVLEAEGVPITIEQAPPIQKRPALHLTNWSSRKQHGPGRRLCAMALPRAWEKGDGKVSMVAPRAEDLLAIKDGTLSVEVYQARYRMMLRRQVSQTGIGPGQLVLDRGDPVEDGDTLLCACPRPDSPRRHHECHIEWLAPFLRRAGWRVVLYGEEFDG